jgi:Rab-GTPase-TBC domain
VFAKDKTSNKLSNHLEQGLEHPLARPLLSRIPENIRSQFLSSQESKTLLEDYDSAHRYLAQFSTDIQSRMGIRKTSVVIEKDTSHDYEKLQEKYKSHFTGTPLTKESFSESENKFEIACRVFCGGIEPQLRPTIWPMILKAIDWDGGDITQKLNDYNEIKSSWKDILSATGNSSPVHFDNPTNTAGDENENQDVVGKIVERIYRIDKDVVRTDQSVGYYVMDPPLDTTIPLRINIEANGNLEMLRNVLMTYTVVDFDLGYVQGMNDLCAPVLEVIGEEGLAFWCFKGFMERMVSFI